jgi:hypothetical protein
LIVRDSKEYVARRLEFQREALRAHVWQSCMNCEHFKKQEELCTVYKARPPAHVIAVGCTEYEWEIPF